MPHSTPSDEIPNDATPSPTVTLSAQPLLSASHLSDFPAGEQICVKGFPSNIGRRQVLTHQPARAAVLSTVGLQDIGDRILLRQGDQLRVALPDMNGDGWAPYPLTGPSLKQLALRHLGNGALVATYLAVRPGTEAIIYGIRCSIGSCAGWDITAQVLPSR